MSEESEQNSMEFEGTDFEKSVLRYTYNCRTEAYEAKRERMLYNRYNFDTFNLRGDFSHKKKGQSREFLPKQRGATQQLSSFIAQTIVDSGDWFSVEERDGVKNPPITGDEIKKILSFHLERMGLLSWLDDSIKLSVLGSLMTTKISGEWVESYNYKTQKKVQKDGSMKNALIKEINTVWRPKMSFTRQEDYFPDPTGQKLFDIHQAEVDLHIIKKMAEGEHPLYDKEVTDKIVGGFEDLEQEARKARETNQIMTFHTSRKRCRVWECYGTILDPSTGEIIMENAMWTVCNDRFLIQRPIPNPFWHGEWPQVTAALLRVPNSVWHTAVADSPTNLNLALNELFNLQLDSGLMATWGIRQIRPAWLSDDTKYSDGIGPGETLEVNEACPPGMKVMEPVQTSEMSPEAMQAYQQVNGEFNQAAMTNDIRMGNIPNRDVRATEVVEANQTITSMLGAIAKMIEEEYLLKVLLLLWKTIAQHIGDMDKNELEQILGKDRAQQILAMGPEEVFAASVQGNRFKVYGLSEAMSRMKDFRKIATLLQTISGNEMLMQEFVKKYDFGKLLSKILRSLDVDVEDLEINPDETGDISKMLGGVGMGATPNTQSQTPQMGSSSMAQTGNGVAQPAALQNASQYAHAASNLMQK